MNNDGHVLREDFVRIMGSGLPEYDWNKYFDYLDTDNDNKLDYNEFKTGAMDKKEMLSDENLEIVFGILDQNKDGYLDAEDLQDAF